MDIKTKELLEEIKAYRNDMVARNYPYQQITNIITKWEIKETPSEKLQNELEPITDEIDESDIKDFLEQAEKEKRELNESYEESMRQYWERKKK